MEKCTLSLIGSCVKRLQLSIFVFFSTFGIYSCSKISEERLPTINDGAIHNAKEFSLSETSVYNFLQDSVPRSKSSSSTFLFDWDNSIVLESKSTIAFEVPLIEQTELTLYACEYIHGEKFLEGEYPTTTRLVVRQDKSTGIYDQFIVTKIWLKTMPDIKKHSFENSTDDAITLLYDVKGNFISEYKLQDGIYTFQSMTSNESMTYLLISKYPPSYTKVSMFSSGNDMFYCRYCDIYFKNMRCPKCNKEGQMKVGDVFVSSVPYYNARWAVEKLSSIISSAMSNHKCERFCYGKDLRRVNAHIITSLQNLYGASFISFLFYETDQTFSPYYLYDDNIAYLCENFSGSVDRILDMPGDALYMIVTKTCTYLCSIPTGGSGGSGGTDGGGTPNPDPDVNCNDPKCPDCGGCISSTKPNCVKCKCNHNHENCMFCNKCIKPNNRGVTKSTTHTPDCPTCECVCPSCGASINPETMTFDCLLEISEIFVSTGPDIMRGFTFAFNKMMTNANADKVEYGGALSKFVLDDNDNIDGIDATFVNPSATYLMVYWDKVNNSSNRSWTYKCSFADDPKQYVVCYPNSKPTLVKYRDYANVHTHPSYLNINQGNIINGHMSYNHLGVTSSDMKSIHEYGCIYILNERNVYELKDNVYSTGKAKIIYKF